MKKIISFILTISMCLTMLSVLSACDNKIATKHIHTYENIWLFDSTHHWYACEDEACTSISQKEEHQFVEDRCSVCSFENNIVIPPPANFVSNEVNEEQFRRALSIGDEAVITITYNYKYETNIGNAVIRCNKNAIYFQSTDNINGATEVYYDVKTQDKYVYNYFVLDEPYEYSGWVREPLDSIDESHIALKALEKFETMFSVVEFSNCAYSDGYYTCLIESMIWKFQFEDGVLVSFSNTSVNDEDEFSETYVFSNYGDTIVTLPTEYIDIDELIPTPSSKWAAYFDFDNVTVEKTWTYPTYTVLENLKRNQNCWEYSADGGIYYYFDGNMLYGNDAEMYNDPLSIINSFLLPIDLFKNYEAAFTETSDGIYMATECANVTNIVIIVNNEKIVSVVYDIVYDNEIASISYIFSNWGTTAVKNSSNTETNWEKYFDFESLENVTATSTYVYDYTKVGTMQQCQDSTLKICGEQRLLTDKTSYWTDMDENGEWKCDSIITSTYYFDGETIYKDDAVYNDISIVTLGEFYGVNSFASYESYFTETSANIYEAANIYTDNGTYTNIKIIVENNHIEFVEYEYIYAGITSKSTLAFYDWGTTTIN